MSHYGVGCDAHRRYSQFAILDQDGHLCHQSRVDHQRGPSRPSWRTSRKALPSPWRPWGTGTGSPTRSRPLAVCPS